ncbi:hypothetical protein [Flavobacterium sp. ZT3R18]|uniref:hypothetical protein n=1 Tax=Flavobacterium sp. ZT3R18 TaxID=2594429 RepID=UPI002103C9B0|nr:hypothetical protein [Flavobacterium sp. ZT3R18]
MLKYTNFAVALESTTKVVNILIDSADLQTLKDAHYMLCFAKKVGDTYNVVWQAYAEYLGNNEFSWTPQYQLFGTNTFKDAVTVKGSTNIVSIGLGEQSTLNTAGVLSAPVSGGSDIAINMVNNYGNIHPGVNQLSYGVDGSQVSTPIYVAEDVMVSGTAELVPVEQVMVWFQQNISTSTMFSTVRSNAVEIDLTTTNEESRLYKGGKWSKV